MAADPRLDGIRAKIDRASIQLGRFEHDAAAFQRGAFTTRVEPDFKAGVFRLFAKDMGLGDPPIQLRLLAGEIAYQLRSALDHLAYIFAVQTSEWNREFPIFDTHAGYQTKGLSKIKGMSAYHETVVESVQPYKRKGDGGPAHFDPLWMLHSINIVDKHRVIPACATYPSDLRVKVQTATGFDTHLVHMLPGVTRPTDGTEITSFPWPDLHASVNVDTFCVVAFEKIADLQFQPIVPFFTDAICEVADIVNRF
jgi:hypothetical protein